LSDASVQVSVPLHRTGHKRLCLAQATHKTTAVPVLGASRNERTQYLDAVVDVLVDEPELGSTDRREDLRGGHGVGVPARVLRVRGGLTALMDSGEAVVALGA
jgi:hypothetical protein